ncbi:uncharacterized protein An14g01930 [Aspergillus niger]|uniref:Contig An14c0090, genomic contig n=2 Tax=Aspergillus niger TaxID=5061 RepID=A2R2T9_ASPNC|nr:uncharacterized protein An14g01930 [Aspergillus niger]CAK41930.1 unnamed protein product [Aspergillus niger]
MFSVPSLTFVGDDEVNHRTELNVSVDIKSKLLPNRIGDY